MAFGPAAFAQFFELGTKYGEYVREGAWNWNELASVYAMGRWLGADAVLAGSLHAIVAIAAAFLVWLAWREDWDGKIPLTSAAALLISPYLFTYDAVLLTLALGWLRGPKALAVWALLAIPLGESVRACGLAEHGAAGGDVCGGGDHGRRSPSSYKPSSQAESLFGARTRRSLTSMSGSPVMASASRRT